MDVAPEPAGTAAAGPGGGGPILFLDVDGPLNPYAAPAEDHPEGYLTHRMRPASWAQDYPPVSLHGGGERIPTLRVWLNPAHGEALLRLPVELVWATTWGHEANEWIGPHLGLPELPAVEWTQQDTLGSALDGGRDDGASGGEDDDEATFWETRFVAAYAAGRPFAWFDDQIEAADVRWCDAHHPAPTLLLPIDPTVGLRDGDFEAVERWAKQL